MWKAEGKKSQRERERGQCKALTILNIVRLEKEKINTRTLSLPASAKAAAEIPWEQKSRCRKITAKPKFLFLLRVFFFF